MTLFSDILLVFEIQWWNTSSPLQGGEIQCAPPCIAVHKENVYIAVNLLVNKMIIFRSADCANWQKVAVPYGAISCHGLASDGEDLFLYYLTPNNPRLFLGRQLDDFWIVSAFSCPIVQSWPGMCVREGRVSIVSGFSVDRVTAVPFCTTYNSKVGSWSRNSDDTKSFPDLLLTEARGRPDLFCIDDEWYIVGGSNLSSYQALPILKLKKLAGTWSWTATDFPFPPKDTATAERDGWLFFAGGTTSLDVTLSTSVCLNVRSGEMVQLPHIPNKRERAVLTVFRDKLVLFGGNQLGIKWHFDDLLILDLSK